MNIKIDSQELLAYIKEKYGLDELKCDKFVIHLDIYAKMDTECTGEPDKVWRHITITRDNGDLGTVEFFIEGEKK